MKWNSATCLTKVTGKRFEMVVFKLLLASDFLFLGEKKNRRFKKRWTSL